MPKDPDKPKILIFAFGGRGYQDQVNISELTAEKLKTSQPDADVKIVVLPVDYKRIDKLIEKATRNFKPDYIIATGETNSPIWSEDENAYRDIRIEKRAENIYMTDFYKEEESPINAKENSHLLGANGVKILDPSSVNGLTSIFNASGDAGHCNYIYFQSLKLMKELGKEGNAVFLHLLDPVAKKRELSPETRIGNLLLDMRGLEKVLGLNQTQKDNLRLLTKAMEKMDWENAPYEDQEKFFMTHETEMKELRDIVVEKIEGGFNDLEFETYAGIDKLTFEQVEQYEQVSTQYAQVIDQYVQNIADFLNSKNSAPAPAVKF